MSFAARRRTAAVLALTLACSGLYAQSQGPFKKKRRTDANQEVLVDSHVHYTDQCTSASAPLIDVTQPPQHGRVDVREGDVIAKPHAVGIADCTGTTLRGVLVYYTPARDFVGQEFFTYDVKINPHPAVHHEVTVSVRAARAASQP